MLTQLVQEMRVGSHIPYRRSEWAAWGHPGARPGTRGWRLFLRAAVRGWEEKSGVPIPFWVTQEVTMRPPACSRLLHGRARLRAAHLPLDQEPGPQPEEGLLGPRGGCGECAGPPGTNLGAVNGHWAPSVPVVSNEGRHCLSLLQKLLRAVAKYGEQDWFKIRAEVPGRSDAQCRDR